MKLAALGIKKGAVGNFLGDNMFENIIRDYDVDVFIHGWSHSDCNIEERIIKEYNPKDACKQ